MAILRRTKLFMDTVVDIQVVLASSDASELDAGQRMDRAFEAFRSVELACSRFSQDSELMQACRTVGSPTPLSPWVFEPLKFALEMAELTQGAFDPTVGRRMEQSGFNRHYLTEIPVDTPASDTAAYTDIELDDDKRTLLLKKPLVIDLGAVAKGFAIDLAAQELKPLGGFMVNAGGDLYAGGTDAEGAPWRIGIQHPLQADEIIHTLHISNQAVCTSGSYERRSDIHPGVHHIMDPRTGQSPNDWISCSVVAPFSMMADAFSTAAFLLGANKGLKLLEDMNLPAILITSDLQIVQTRGV